MFTRVLAPIDTHPDAVMALHLAEHIARRTHARLTLLRVLPTTAREVDVMDHYDELSRMADDIEARGVTRPESIVAIGQPDTRILETAERTSAELIVLAPHARAGLDALRRRSVTARLMTHTSIPLLIAPEQSEATWSARDLLVAVSSLVITPVDGTALAEQAIPIGLRIAELWGRPVLLLRAIEPPSMYSVVPENMRLERRLSDERAQRVRNAMSQLRARVARQTAVPIEAMVRWGAPDEVIAQATKSYPGSLIVMSMHGRRAAERALLGSVALNVMRRTHEPLLILPPGASMGRAERSHMAVALSVK